MPTRKSNKAIHITLWIAQGFLAAMFIMAGFSKTTQPIEQLSATAPWTSNVPAALKIKPELTAWAAVGLAMVIIFAIGYHISQGEVGVIGVIALIAVVVAWGRFNKAPIYAKA